MAAEHPKNIVEFVSLTELKYNIRYTATIVITDQQVFDIYTEIFNTKADKLIVLPKGASYKTGDYFIYLCNELTKRHASKNTHLLAIGGGSISDLVGFVAAVYMRGIKVSFAPTTLLAMVDAAIGGKNAIDIGNIKNIVGSVYCPQNVFIYKNFIASTSQIEILSGMAEVIKIALLTDKSLLNNCLQIMNIIKHNPDITGLLDNALFNEIIKQSIQHKLNIVAEDKYSVGKRHLLNFGHTVGHALELQYHLPHGWAVALSMLIETNIACELKLTTPDIFSKICDIISTYYNFEAIVPSFN